MTQEAALPALERRFGGIDRLYGPGSVERLAHAHVCVIGIGGVGAWGVETLARSGVGHLTLIDLDHVAESNFNRQVHALESTLGQAKVLAMQDRIAQINPACQVRVVEEFVSVENVARLLPSCDVLIDCIDQVDAKAALIAFARRHALPVLTTGGAGGRTDPTRIRMDDLASTSGDGLARSLRVRLRKEHGFPRGAPFGIPCVYSGEPIRRPESARCQTIPAPQGLHCAGYGSSMAVTAAFGCAVAAGCLDILLP